MTRPADRGRLRVGIVSPLWAAVPPATYGGIERHLYLLAEELVRRGHAVTLFASGDSRTSAALHGVCERAVAETMDRGEAFLYEPYLNTAVAEALRASEDLDVLHLHVGSSAIPFDALARAPVLHTFHTGLTADDAWILRRFPQAALTALSRRQLDPLPAEQRARIRVVPYGFDFDACTPAESPAEHLVFLGRMAPHKAPDDAIRIARAAGRPLHLAGAPVTREEREWFAREIEPEIDGESVVWVGAVDDAAKEELFRRAAALLFPIRWEEPFGLVMLEALARGVPVLACARGSVSEVIEPGATGFTAQTPGELAAFVEPAARLERKAVRERARQRFGVERMTNAYVARYASLVRSWAEGAA